MRDTHSVISLFSGAGGFSCGFAQAGMTPIFGADIHPDACASYELNLSSRCHCLDLAHVLPSAIKTMAGGKPIFAIIGGPPCQGFSTAGLREAGDARNQLIFNYLAIVGEILPQWFVFENVEGLLTSRNGADVVRLVKACVALGYSVRLEKVNFAAYGVPQTRKRVIIIGNRMGIDFDFPHETCSYDSGKSKKHSILPMAPTLDDALSGFGNAGTDKKCTVTYSSTVPLNPYDALMRNGNEKGYVAHHFSTVKDSDKKKFELLKPGHSMKDLPEQFWHDSFQRRANRRVADGTATEKRGGAPHGIKRLHGHLQALTVTGAASREFIHPQKNRPLTIRECARIQSFPDVWQWAGNTASIAQQIGNAVPPIAARILAQHLQKTDGEFGSGLRTSRCTNKPGLINFSLTESTGMSPALKTTHALLATLRQQEFSFNDQKTK